MKNKNKKKEPEFKVCLTCSHCIYIGEGDYICDVDEPIIIMEEYIPNDNYWYCAGCDYEEE